MLSMVFLLAARTLLPSPALAQSADNRSAQSNRAQIEAALAEAEKIVASPGYSGRIKSAKRREIAVLKSRLEDGDLQPGDQIALQVAGEDKLTTTFVVDPQRNIALPGLGDVSLRGVLRSELQGYMTAQIAKYIKDPVVHALPTIRLSFLGGVGKPGFYQVAAGLLPGDAIMGAGGPANNVDPANTTVERAGVEIMSKESFRQSMIDGKSLDQLNLRAGDEILVGGWRVPPGSNRSVLFTTVLPVIGAVGSLGYLAARIFKF